MPIDSLTSNKPVTISGENLKLEDVVRVARGYAKAHISDDPIVQKRVRDSNDFIVEAVEANEPIYGVTSGFGAMAFKVIPKDQAIELQNNIPFFHKVGVGNRIPNADVRAGMVLRMNSLLRGASGIRMELIKRMEIFLNEDATPHIFEFASIGASGDLAPLSYITANIIGLDPSWKADYRGQEIDCVSLLEKLGLERISLGPKEGLAMCNGTSVMAGIAANCIRDTQTLLALSMAAHGLLFQGLGATNQSFHPFIHQHKPHRGQVSAAATMLEILSGSQLIRDELEGQHAFRGDEPIQDRYSLRCLPQYMGPIFEGIYNVAQQIETEINSATDNPLIDYVNRHTYHGGNFLGQYVGVGMDELRYHIGMLAKHLDVQIGMAVTPAFNGGLPALLVGNPDRPINSGLQGLQICGNCIMPQLTFYGNSLADRFPTHAEGFNQNINSQGFGSANLARRSVEIFQQYIALSLIFAVQSADLRTKIDHGHFDASKTVSPVTKALYEAVYEVVGHEITGEKALVRNDYEQSLESYVALIAADIKNSGKIVTAIQTVEDLIIKNMQ